jgi:protein SFI1
MSAPKDDVAPLTNEGMYLAVSWPFPSNTFYIEIETLYDIVCDAQKTLPDRPFRALFKAYDRVLAEKNKTDDTGRYFTFLYRLQDQASQDDEELVDRFRRLLAEQGIQVEIDPEGEGVEVTTNLDNARRTQSGSTQNILRPGFSRRGSLESFFDGSADKVPGMDTGELPVRSRRPSRPASDTGGLPNRRERSVSAARVPIQTQLPMRGRASGQANRRATSETLADRPKRNSSISNRESLRIHRDIDTGTRQSDYEGDYSEPTDSFDRSHIQIPGVNAPLPEEGEDGRGYGVSNDLYRPSDTQMERDAETFAYHQAFARERSFFQRWLDRLRDHQQKRQDMEATAVAFDRNILLKASLDCWRAALQIRRSAADTDRFFERLTERADKARNLFLLTKAFTHWAQIADDEVQRTSTAKRHILRTRYFNAWRDITTVNELKIQRFIFTQFLRKWRSRTAAVREQNELAVSLYEHNIVHKLYWLWFWKFAEQKAPMWHDSRLSKGTIRKWADAVGDLQEREAWANGQRNRQVMEIAFAKMKEKATAVQFLEAQADEFRHASLLSSSLYTMRTSARLAPLKTQVVAKVESRLTRMTFQAWHRAAQLSRQAREVNRLRIIRNSFTAWNDRMRMKAIQEIIDERVQVRCLYLWTLAARVPPFQRVHDDRLKVTFFSNWVKKAQTREKALNRAERRFATFKRTQMLRTSLRAIVDVTLQRRNQEYLAVSAYEPKLMQRTFGKLLEKHRNLQELDNWAERANYYVTTKNTIKRWQEATQYARRTRRREAYAQIRRTVKLNLVRRTFGTWKEKSAQTTAAHLQADQMAKDHLLRMSGALIGNWRDTTAHYRDLGTQAVQTCSLKLTASTLELWVEKLRKLQTMGEQAIALKEESTQVAASTCLKRLGWRLWTVERQGENANALRQRTFEKHVRAMIRFWWEQTSKRVAERAEETSPSDGRRAQDDEDDDDGNLDAANDDTGIRDQGRHVGDSTMLDEPGDETQRLETWTPFKENSLGAPNLDLSFTVSPPRTASHPHISTSSSARRPAPPRSFPQRPIVPRTEPRRRLQPQLRGSSIIRPRPLAPRVSPIIELPDTDPEMLDLGIELDPDGEDPNSTFWTSTPMPPRRPHPNPPPLPPPSTMPKPAATQKPGYLKTPSKRSVVRERTKRLDGVGVGDVGGSGSGGVSSFQARLREGYRT